MIDDVLGIPDQLRDALWRVESARLEAAEAEGLLVCGMGGSAIGGDLAAAALGSRLRRPLVVSRGYAPPSWVGEGWTVLCCSYSGGTEETISCFDAATELGARRLVASTGGALVERARGAGVPVVGLPGIFQPRAAVAYFFTVVAEVAALAGAAPRIATEIEAAADFLGGELEQLKHQAAEIAAQLEGRAPVVYGAELTAPVARRWKTQANENAKVPAFFLDLPEADHNDVCGWATAARQDSFAAVFLEDRDANPRVGERFRLTAEAVAEAGAPVVRVETAGETPTARLLWTTMLGDLVSLELATRRGVDPLPVEAIDRLKQALG
ncbi:MAG TPA: bifunctional phosphoglucose/phosphomannose isomerase [Solirubrobacterales bacterium]